MQSVFVKCGLVLTLLLFSASSVFAQEMTDSLPTADSPIVVSMSDRIAVQKAAIFDASKSLLPKDYSSLLYTWDFGDGNRDQGVEVVHSYVDPGEYTLHLEIIVDGEIYAEREFSLFVYRQLYFLITDQVENKERIQSMLSFARDRGVYVQLISNFDSVSEFIAEEDLLQKLNEASSDLQKAEAIIVWTRGASGLAVLSRFSQSFTTANPLQDRSFVVITDQNFRTIGNIAQGTLRTVKPEQMVLAGSEALWMLFEVETVTDFILDLEQRGIQFDLLTREDKLSPFNVLSFFVNYMVQKGVPTNSLLLILMLPLIVTIVAFLKQVIGLTTMGVYTPSIIALSFVALGIQFGLLILIVILLFGTLTRLFLQRYRMLYIPRMAVVLTIVSLTILLMMLVGAYFDISQLVSISVFPMLIMSTMVEKFVNVQSTRGFRQAVVMIGSTLFVAVVCYYVVEWPYLKTLILGHPELILLFLLINVFLGRWTGLRLLEYVRFREIFRYTEEE